VLYQELESFELLAHALSQYRHRRHLPRFLSRWTTRNAQWDQPRRGPGTPAWLDLGTVQRVALKEGRGLLIYEHQERRAERLLMALSRLWCRLWVCL